MNLLNLSLLRRISLVLFHLCHQEIQLIQIHYHPLKIHGEIRIRMFQMAVLTVGCLIQAMPPLLDTQIMTIKMNLYSTKQTGKEEGDGSDDYVDHNPELRLLLMHPQLLQ